MPRYSPLASNQCGPVPNDFIQIPTRFFGVGGACCLPSVDTVAAIAATIRMARIIIDDNPSPGSRNVNMLVSRMQLGNNKSMGVWPTDNEAFAHTVLVERVHAIERLVQFLFGIQR